LILNGGDFVADIEGGAGASRIAGGLPQNFGIGD
jgi:hypothetical protein